MPIIPTVNVEDGPQLPNSVGFYKENIMGRTVDSAGQHVAGALDSLGDMFVKAEREKTDREQKANILAAQNELTQMNIERFAKTQQERQGASALPDANSGYKGAYKDYDSDMSSYVPKLIEKYNINPDYVPLAMEKFDGLVNQYRDNYANWEGAQLQVYRKSQVESASQIFGMQAVTDAGNGQGIAAAETAVNNFKETVDFIYGGTNKEFADSLVRGFAKNTVKDVLQSWAESDPVSATSALKSETIKNYLDPEEVHGMQAMLEAKVMPFRVQKATDELMMVPGYENQLTAARSLYKDDPEFLKKVEREIDSNEAERVHKLNGDTLEMVSDDGRALLDPTKKLPSHNAYEKYLNDRYTDPTQFNDMEKLLNLRDRMEEDRKPKKPEKDKLSNLEKLLARGAIQSMVYGQGIKDIRGVLGLVKTGAIPDELIPMAMDIAEDNAKTPSFGNELSYAKDLNKNLFKKHPEVDAAFTNAMVDWKENYKRSKGKEPSPDETRDQAGLLVQGEAKRLLEPGNLSLNQIFGDTKPKNAMLLRTPAGEPQQAAYQDASGRYWIKDAAGRKSGPLTTEQINMIYLPR